MLLALVFLVVWYGWKYTRRVDQIRRALQEEMERRRNAAPGGRGDGARNLPAEDLIKCDSCGAYVPAQSAASCGRADCPWR